MVKVLRPRCGLLSLQQDIQSMVRVTPSLSSFMLVSLQMSTVIRSTNMETLGDMLQYRGHGYVVSYLTFLFIALSFKVRAKSGAEQRLRGAYVQSSPHG